MNKIKLLGSIIILTSFLVYMISILFDIFQKEPVKFVCSLIILYFMYPFFYDTFQTLQNKKNELRKFKNELVNLDDPEIKEFKFYSIFNYLSDFSKYISSILLAVIIYLLIFLDDDYKLIAYISLSGIIIFILIFISILLLIFYHEVIITLQSNKQKKLRKVLGLINRNIIVQSLNNKGILTDKFTKKDFDIICYKKEKGYAIKMKYIRNKEITFSYNDIHRITVSARKRNLLPTIGIVESKKNNHQIITVPILELLQSIFPNYKFNDISDYLNEFELEKKKGTLYIKSIDTLSLECEIILFRYNI